MIEEEKLRKLKQTDMRGYINSLYNKATKLVLNEEIAQTHKDSLVDHLRMRENKDHDPDPKTSGEVFLEAILSLVNHELSKKNQLLTNLDIKAGVIKVPPLMTKISGFKPDDDVVISADKGIVKIEKHDIKKGKDLYTR